MRGKAWSGTGPVTQVDVSFTGEGDWHAANVEAPKGPYQWQDWSLEWEANNIGRHTLRARATDAAGHVQPDVPPWNRLGYGNNAIEVIYVDISGGGLAPPPPDRERIGGCDMLAPPIRRASRQALPAPAASTSVTEGRGAG